MLDLVTRTKEIYIKVKILIFKFCATIYGLANVLTYNFTANVKVCKTLQNQKCEAYPTQINVNKSYTMYMLIYIRETGKTEIKWRYYVVVLRYKT